MKLFEYVVSFILIGFFEIGNYVVFCFELFGGIMFCV